MSESSERRLRLWAIASMAIVIAMVTLPVEGVKNLTNLFEASSPIDYVFKVLFTGTILLLVLGFYLRMLLECGFGQRVHYRGAWLALLIFVPLVSAYVYYWVTRSSRYRRSVSSLAT
jgi:hypothetical protein